MLSTTDSRSQVHDACAFVTDTVVLTVKIESSAEGVPCVPDVPGTRGRVASAARVSSGAFRPSSGRIGVAAPSPRLPRAPAGDAGRTTAQIGTGTHDEDGNTPTIASTAMANVLTTMAAAGGSKCVSECE